MLVESLELRQLMSVTVQALPNGGVLVKGTNGDDLVLVGQQDDALVVQNAFVNDAGQLEGVEGDPAFLATSGIKYVIVDLGAGNDRIAFFGQNGNAVIFTGNGSDHADVTALGTQTVLLDTGNSDDTVFIDAHDTSCVTAFARNGDDAANIIVTDDAHVYYNAGAGIDSTTLINSGNDLVNGDPSQIIYNSGSGIDVPVVAIPGTYVGG
jgi:hypothetical protein